LAVYSNSGAKHQSPGHNAKIAKRLFVIFQAVIVLHAKAVTETWKSFFDMKISLGHRHLMTWETLGEVRKQT